MTRIKICGLKSERDIDAAARLPLSYVGFVFARTSTRYISFDLAKSLREQLISHRRALHLPPITTVGVFVNEDISVVARALAEGACDLAQLHGSEDNDYITRLRVLTHKPCIQAFRVHDENDIARAQKSAADMIILDAGSGEGKRFNWELARNVSRPFILAGGLTPTNVQTALDLTHAWGVDVSSGVEENGIKSLSKMNAFCEAVEAFDRVGSDKIKIHSTACAHGR